MVVPEPLDELRSAIQKRQALVLVGAGVSIGATRGQAVKVGKKTFPIASWPGLLHHGVSYCEKWLGADLPPGWARAVRAEIKVGECGSLIGACTKIEEKLKAPGGLYIAWLQSSIGALEIVDDSVLKAVAALGLPIATTNYDRLLESESITGYPAVNWTQRHKVQPILRGEKNGIIHLHGDYDDPGSIVLGHRSYAAVERDPHAQAVLQGIFSSRTVLLVGFGGGLSDPNFGPLLKWVAAAFVSSTYHHFLLCLEKELKSIKVDYPIQPLVYGNAHADLAPFLQRLAPSPPPPPSPIENKPPFLHFSRISPPSPEPPFFGPHLTNREEFIEGDATRPRPIEGADPHLLTKPGLRLFFHHLIDSHTKLFAGREVEISRIEEFIAKRGSGYVFVEGFSGYGKTSLLAQVAHSHPHFAYHFISQRYKGSGSYFDPTSLEYLLTNLWEQVASQPVPSGDLRVLRIEFQRLLSEPTQKQLVIVLDAVDEVDRHPNYLLGLLPRILPQRVVIILSARTQGDRCYLSEVGLTRDDVGLYLWLSGLDETSIAHLLQIVGGKARPLAEDQAFVRKVRDVSNGDPFYLRFLVEDIARGTLTAQNIDRAPSGLAEYLNQQLSQLNSSAHRAQHRDIIGFILTADGALSRSDLISMVPGLDGLNFDDTLRDIHRFLLVHDDQYTFCHIRFKEYFAEKMN